MDSDGSGRREVPLPIPGKRNVLITSALPYVNNVPHLGNIIGCVLSADVFARYCRARQYNSIFVCGTDEYGTATETKALEEGVSCQEICDKYHELHKGIYDWFDISFDKFGRTTTSAQTDIAQSIFHDLRERGLLQERSTEQLFSVALNKFLADRYVCGTCPKCGYEDARGDQCDACGGLLNPTELLRPRCKMSGTTPELRETTHLYLDLPALSKRLTEYHAEAAAAGGWSQNCQQVTAAWMAQGLKERCITRDLKWGTPVPMEGYEDKVFYVWYDAPIGYVSITANLTPEWERWWKNPDEVELVQFMGKDNIPFHTVIFPACLLGTERPWTMMKKISVTEYLNYEDGKFSKSRGVGVFGNDAKCTGIPVEAWRYYLLAVRPESADSVFQWSDLAARTNADLNDNLGNFVNRSLKFIAARFDRRVPGVRGDAGAEQVAALGLQLRTLVAQYVARMEDMRLRDALREAMNVSRAGNGFFQETEIWAAIKTDPDACAGYISAAAGVIYLLCSLLQPFMPSFSRACLAQLGVAERDALPLTDKALERVLSPATLLPAGHALGEGELKPLFCKIAEEEAEALRVRFGGDQEARRAQEELLKLTVTLQQTDAKKKKEKGAPKGKGAPKAAPEPAREVDLSRVDLRVGVIQKVWRHPDADSLYVEEIDVGEPAPRTVVSGLVKHVPQEQMLGARVVAVCNLKPANMRGQRSEAMVLAASSADGSRVELVRPPPGAAPGDRVTAAGFDATPDERLNPKLKIFEAVAEALRTDDELVACYRGLPLSCGAGECRVDSLAQASIR